MFTLSHAPSHQTHVISLGAFRFRGFRVSVPQTIKLYRYVLPHRVAILRRFGLKTGTHFAHFRLESGMVFEGTSGVYERIYRFNCK